MKVKEEMVSLKYICGTSLQKKGGKIHRLGKLNGGTTLIDLIDLEEGYS